MRPGWPKLTEPRRDMCNILFRGHDLLIRSNDLLNRGQVLILLSDWLD